MRFRYEVSVFKRKQIIVDVALKNIIISTAFPFIWGDGGSSFSQDEYLTWLDLTWVAVSRAQISLRTYVCIVS